MYRAEPIINEILDVHRKQRAYEKHIGALHAVRSAIDTSRPPPNARLEALQRRCARDRARRLCIANRNIRAVNAVQKQRAQARVVRMRHDLDSCSVAVDFDDALSQKTTNSARTEQSEMDGREIGCDGMTVVDSIRPRPLLQQARPPKIVAPCPRAVGQKPTPRRVPTAAAKKREEEKVVVADEGARFEDDFADFDSVGDDKDEKMGVFRATAVKVENGCDEGRQERNVEIHEDEQKKEKDLELRESDEEKDVEIGESDEEKDVGIGEGDEEKDVDLRESDEEMDVEVNESDEEKDMEIKESNRDAHEVAVKRNMTYELYGDSANDESAVDMIRSGNGEDEVLAAEPETVNEPDNEGEYEYEYESDPPVHRPETHDSYEYESDDALNPQTKTTVKVNDYKNEGDAELYDFCLSESASEHQVPPPKHGCEEDYEEEDNEAELRIFMAEF